MRAEHGTKWCELRTGTVSTGLKKGSVCMQWNSRAAVQSGGTGKEGLHCKCSYCNQAFGLMQGSVRSRYRKNALRVWPLTSSSSPFEKHPSWRSGDERKSSLRLWGARERESTGPQEKQEKIVWSVRSTSSAWKIWFNQSSQHNGPLKRNSISPVEIISQDRVLWSVW